MGLRSGIDNVVSLRPHKCRAAERLPDIHRGTVALPFCNLTLKAKKPLSSQYPRELRTWGDHLRKRRLDLGLLQREVAARLGTDVMTVNNWECYRTVPMVQWLPRIIGFLGYAPYDPSWGLGRRFRTAREALGWSRRRMAKALGVDERTVLKWEWEKPTRKALPQDRFKALLRYVKTYLSLR
jgi:transcriptional regulator with XRE-family HTH domain